MTIVDRTSPEYEQHQPMGPSPRLQMAQSSA